MLTLKVFQPGAEASAAHPYIFYVSQQDDVIMQESARHYCHEILLRWASLEYAKKGGGIREEPYCFRPGHGHGYMSPGIQMVLTWTTLAPSLFANAVETYIHPIEQAADIMPTNVTKVGDHAVFLQGDRRWAANALAMSIWLQLLRATASWREREGTWLKFVHEHSYFSQVPTASRLKLVWSSLPRLIEHKFARWCGYPVWSSHCGVYSQIYIANSTNELGQWMWKHCWKDGNE